MNQRSAALTFALYQGSGVVTFVLGTGLMAGLEFLGVGMEMATAANYFVSIALGFVLNWRFVFSGDRRGMKAVAVRYWAGYLGLLGIVTGLQSLLALTGIAPRWVAVGLGMAVYGGLGYFLSRFWVFRGVRAR